MRRIVCLVRYAKSAVDESLDMDRAFQAEVKSSGKSESSAAILDGIVLFDVC